MGSSLIDALLLEGYREPREVWISNRGIEISSVERALVEKNILAIDRATPIECLNSGAISTFKNQAPDGESILAFDPNGSKYFPDRGLTLEAELEDAVVTSLLK